MAHDAAPILARYAAAAGSPGAAGDGSVWEAVARAVGRVGAAQVVDGARRAWVVEPRREPTRGRIVVVRPAHGDNEPFRASADGFGPDAYLPISPEDWTLLALLACGREGDEGRSDEELRHAVHRLVSQMVVEAHHRGLMGATEDEDDDA